MIIITLAVTCRSEGNYTGIPVILPSNEGTKLLLQPVTHHSMLNILTTLFEALSSNELV